MKLYPLGESRISNVTNTTASSQAVCNQNSQVSLLDLYIPEKATDC